MRRSAGPTDWHQVNAELTAEQLGHPSFWRYLTSADPAVDVAENWQSELLQFSLYLMATAWLLQRRSPESKELDKAGRETDEEQKVGKCAEDASPAWAGPAAGARGSTPRPWPCDGLDLPGLLAGAVDRRLGGVQRDAAAAAAGLAVLTVFLRQRGSPESKPVGEPYTSTGVDG